MKKIIVSLALVIALVAIGMPLAIASADTEQPLDHVALSPTSVTIPVNGTQQFAAVAQDSANISITDVSYTWSVTAGSGNITASGLYTAGSSTGNSTIQVSATQNSITKTAVATVTIIAYGPFHHVVISPTSVDLLAGATQQFTAVGQDSANNTVPDVTYAWSITAGSGNITASGLYTSGSTAGTSTVQVTASKDGVTKTAFATVVVSLAEQQCSPFTPPGFDHGKKKGWGGEQTPPGWSKRSKTGWGTESSPPGHNKQR